MKVENMCNSNGNVVKNQFIVTMDDGTIFFQSYQSVIVKISPDGAVILDACYWDYSMTTGKYRNQFLNESKKETARKIADGIYKLDDLNKK